MSKGFKTETVRKIVNKLNTTEKMYRHYLEKGEQIKLVISNGNSKIGRCMNVSLAPIITCGNCKECKCFCYDVKACLQYTNVRDARARNTVLALKHRDKFFNAIDKKCSRRRTNKYFRWHVSGDIVDYNYFENMVAIAKEFPDFTFWTYTKNYDVVDSYVSNNGNSKENAIPENFHVMYSEWDGMPIVNPYGFPIFTCKLKSGNRNHPVEFFDSLYKCPGNCDICKACKMGCIGGMDTYADEH